MISKNRKVGELVAEHPLATRVFERYGIDFCCGGGRPVDEVCRARGLDTGAVLEEIAREVEGSPREGKRWDREPLDDLIRHIVASYHRRLDQELPQLEAMARKVVKVHGGKDPERFDEILAVFLGLKTELESHMKKEETILFPMIQKGQGAMASGPIAVMEDEHDSAASALRRLRELTDDFRVPEEACNTWTALWHRLEALEGDLHQHIHLENNILFPRAAQPMN